MDVLASTAHCIRLQRRAVAEHKSAFSLRARQHSRRYSKHCIGAVSRRCSEALLSRIHGEVRFHPFNLLGSTCCLRTILIHNRMRIIIPMSMCVYGSRRVVLSTLFTCGAVLGTPAAQTRPPICQESHELCFGTGIGASVPFGYVLTYVFMSIGLLYTAHQWRLLND